MELLSILKISRQVVFCKKVALKFFKKIYKKTPVPKPATLLKERLWYRCFPVNFAKFLRTTFFIEHLRWLLLNLFQNTYYPNNHYLLCEKSVLCIWDENTFIKNFYANYFFNWAWGSICFKLVSIVTESNKCLPIFPQKKQIFCYLPDYLISNKQ